MGLGKLVDSVMGSSSLNREKLDIYEYPTYLLPGFPNNICRWSNTSPIKSELRHKPLKPRDILLLSVFPLFFLDDYCGCVCFGWIIIFMRWRLFSISCRIIPLNVLNHSLWELLFSNFNLWTIGRCYLFSDLEYTCRQLLFENDIGLTVWWNHK